MKVIFAFFAIAAVVLVVNANFYEKTVIEEFEEPLEVFNEEVETLNVQQWNCNLNDCIQRCKRTNYRTGRCIDVKGKGKLCQCQQ